MSVLLRAAYFVGDLILLNLSIVLSYSLFHISFTGEQRVSGIYLFIFSNLAWLFLTAVSNPYNFSRNWGVTKVFKSQTSFIFIHLMVVASLIYFFKKDYSPLQIGAMYALFFPTFFLWKTFLLYMFKIFNRSEELTRNVIVVGHGDVAEEMRNFFMVHQELKYRFLRLFETGLEGLPMEEIKGYCKENNVHEIFCSTTGVNGIELKKLIEFGLDALIRVKLVADKPLQQKSLELEDHDHVPVISIATIPLDDVKNQLVKRIFDFGFSMVVVILVLSWLTPLIALLIKLESRGPVFFRQPRAGLENKSFSCLKFRTMKLNQEADTKQATKDDPRITRFGKLLRKSSLDEVPQFFNVLWGDMSVIGPRPHPFKLNERFHPELEQLMSRHYVKPGITGLAQCMGYRGETRELKDMRNRVKLDRFYIENWSFVLDIKIVILTVVSLLARNEKAF